MAVALVGCPPTTTFIIQNRSDSYISEVNIAEPGGAWSPNLITNGISIAPGEDRLIGEVLNGTWNIRLVSSYGEMTYWSNASFSGTTVAPYVETIVGAMIITSLS